MKILSVVGARPQFIKAAMVSRILRNLPPPLLSPSPSSGGKGPGEGRSYPQELLLHTGQHYDDNMSQIFFDELHLPRPDVYLGVGSGSHAQQTASILTGVEAVLLSEKPDWVLVYGDTNTTLAAALAASKLHIPVAHVEAGLRSYNRAMPEEINRVLCDHIASALFCPTQAAVDQLRQEGITTGVHCVGDVMADSLSYFLPFARQRFQTLQTSLPALSGILSSSPSPDREKGPGDEGLREKGPGDEGPLYALATVHRASNTDNPANLSRLAAAFGSLEIPVIFPLHPRTRKMLETFSISLPPNVFAIEPVGYLEMLALEENADCILTDSGGIQKEAYWLGVRCITLRDETEWVETVQSGWNILAGCDDARIRDAFQNWHPSGARSPIYGDGHAAERIAAILTA